MDKLEAYTNAVYAYLDHRISWEQCVRLRCEWEGQTQK